MPNPENLIPHHFKPGNRANPKGRPKKFVTLLGEQGYKRHEINQTIQALLSLNMRELEEVIQSKDATVLELTVANALKKGVTKGSVFTTEILISRVFGQPKQEVETTIIAEQPLFPDDPSIPRPFLSESEAEIVVIDTQISK